MLSTYRQRRKDYVRLCRLREAGNVIQHFVETVIDISDDEVMREKLNSLRTQELALLESIEADIPWICKIKPVK